MERIEYTLFGTSKSKLTCNPVIDPHVGFNLVSSICNLNKRLCCIVYVTFGIQGFTMVLLLVSTKADIKGLDQAILFIRFALGVSQPRVEFLDSFFEMGNFVTYRS